MSAIIKHIVTPPGIDENNGGREIYSLKMKDTQDKRAVRIWANGQPMKILEIRIIKTHGVNNGLVVEIIKDKEDKIFLK